EYFPLGTTSRPAAKRKLARLLGELRDGRPASDAATEESVQAYGEAWTQRREAAGIAMGRDEKNYLKGDGYPEIGRLGVSRVQPANIRGIYDVLIAAGRKKMTVVHARALLHRLFRSMQLDELIGRNPVDLAPVPTMKDTRKERAILTDGEV